MEKQYKPVPDTEELRYKGTPEKPDIKIFVSHRIDLDSETIDNPLYIPVRCGAIYDERENVSMLGDDTGDNISEKRMSFCELTVQYWAWKNVKADYYGLCHYRRYLSYKDGKMPVFTNNMSKTGLIYSPDLCTSIEQFKLNDVDLIKESIKNADVIALEPFDLKQVGCSSVYELWQKDICNFDVKVLDSILMIIENKYPYMLKFAKTYFKQSKTTFYNLFVMNKQCFDEYCEFLFGVLFELEEKIDYSHYNSEKKRIIGYIGENLLNIFLIKLKEDKKNIKYLQGIFIDKIVKQEEIFPAFHSKNNTIVFSSSDFFCPYLGAALQSLKDSSVDSQNYDIIVLEKEITEVNKNKLKSILKNSENFSLRFINVSNLVYKAKFYLPEDNPDLAEETYYTILVPWVLKNYKKAIVLDCDIIIKSDLSELYNIELGENYIAAAKEYLFQGFLNNPFINLNNSLTKYCKRELGLKNEFEYFNAGVLLMNLEAFREKFDLESLLGQISENNFRIVEQDFLNKICNGKVVNLDYRWNLMACLSDETIPQIALVPEDESKLYKEAAKSPKILHYITQKKPWKYPELEYADEWWKHARKTIYYEICVYRMVNDCAERKVRILEPAIYDLQKFAGFVRVPDTRSGARKLADKLLPIGTHRREFVKWLIPRDSLRWRFCKQIYYIIRPQYRPVKVKPNKDDTED